MSVLRRVATASTLCVVLSTVVACGPDATEAPGTGDDGEVDAPWISDADELTVAQDGSADFTSIAEAVSAAQEGAIVRIGPGRYEERVVMNRSVLLTGSVDARPVLAGGTADGPVLAIEGAGRVELRHLEVISTAPPLEEQVGDVPVVRVVASKVKAIGLVVAGGPGAGLVVGPGADVRVESSFIAGVGGAGVLAISAPGLEAALTLSDCEIRNCGYSGVQLTRCDATIERCRIHHNRFHGIRFDDAAPTVRDCAIHANEAVGIYAAGRTDSMVVGNLFHANGAGGINCLGTGRDRIHGNTFVASKRAAVALLGDASPILHRNIFALGVTAVLGGRVSPGSDPYDAYCETVGNVVWQIDFAHLGAEGEVSAGANPFPPGNFEYDPGFVDADALDFRLTADSKARAADIGVAEPTSLDPAWPPHPAE